MSASQLPGIFKFTVAVLVILAGIWDLRYRRIPNSLNVAGLMAGFCLNLCFFHATGLRSSLEGIGLSMLIYLPLYLLRGMGAGDVKLMMAVGAIVGPSYWFGIFVGTALIGGFLAVAMVVVKRRVLETWLNLGSLLGELAHFRKPHARVPTLDVRSSAGLRLPHGVAIALGSLATLLVA